MTATMNVTLLPPLLHPSVVLLAAANTRAAWMPAAMTTPTLLDLSSHDPW